jgi:caffeoyl-CoA O-methyltransferase
LLVSDNVLWEGKVVDPQDELTRAIVEFDALVQSDPRVENVCLTVRDGIMLAWKRPQ